MHASPTLPNDSHMARFAQCACVWPRRALSSRRQGEPSPLPFALVSHSGCARAATVPAGQAKDERCQLTDGQREGMARRAAREVC